MCCKVKDNWQLKLGNVKGFHTLAKMYPETHKSVEPLVTGPGQLKAQGKNCGDDRTFYGFG